FKKSRTGIERVRLQTQMIQPSTITENKYQPHFVNSNFHSHILWSNVKDSYHFVILFLAKEVYSRFNQYIFCSKNIQGSKTHLEMCNRWQVKKISTGKHQKTTSMLYFNSAYDLLRDSSLNKAILMIMCLCTNNTPKCSVTPSKGMIYVLALKHC
ncbi:hypothetical protein L9F63_023122, partial [Diploptera punctata]